MNRFSTQNDITNQLSYIRGNIFDSDLESLPYSGPLLMHKIIPFETNYIDASQSHVGIVGGTGYGKSRRALAPAIITAMLKGETVLIEDPKGEHYRNFSGMFRKAGYHIQTLNLNNFSVSRGYNPLEYVSWLYSKGDKDSAALELMAVANLIIPDENITKDPFWNISARNLVYGAAMALLEKAPANQITLESVHRFISDGNKRGNDDLGTYLHKFLDSLPKESVARTSLQDYASTARDTASGIRSSAIQNLQNYTFTEGLNLLLSNPDIKISSIEYTSPNPVVYFVILPEKNKAIFPVASMFISQLVNRYMTLADSHGGALARRLNIFIDELPAIAPSLARVFPTYISTCRSRNIRIYYVIQSFEQLNTAFGHDSKTIMDNTGTMIVFRMNTENSAATVTNMLGNFEYINPYNNHTVSQPVMTPRDICSMEIGQAIVISNGLKFISWLSDYSWIVPSEYMQRQQAEQKPRKRKIYTPFDICRPQQKPAEPKPRNIGTITKETTGKTSVPDLFIGENQDNLAMKKVVANMYSIYTSQDIRLNNVSKTRRQIKDLTERSLLDICKVNIINLGHEQTLITEFAHCCNISMSAAVQILYRIIEEPVELFFEDIGTAFTLATCIERCGGVAEILYLEDDDEDFF